MRKTNWLRWIAVPFASILASFVVNMVGVIYMWINGNGFQLYSSGAISISIVSIILRLIVDYFVGYSFVMAGSYTAPSYNKTVAIVLSTVLVCVCVVSAMLMLVGIASNSFAVWGGLVSSSVGAVIATRMVTNKL